MADVINFTLPKIDEGSDKQTLKQIKNYLFQLTEQMRFYLNNIDSDNFTEEYYEKMSRMVNTETANSKQMNKMQQREHTIINDIKNAKAQIAKTIANNKGGYIIFNDTNDDELPDELIICDRPNLENADKMWRWNLGGLMYNDGGYLPADDMVEINGVWYERDTDDPDHWIESSRKMVVGVDMNGNINASAITTGTLTAIEIKGLSGEIGGWDILSKRLEADNVVYTSGQYVSGYRSGMQALLTDSSIAFYAGCTTPAGGDIADSSNFYVTQGGYLFSKSGKIGGWSIDSKKLYKRVVKDTGSHDPHTYELTLKADLEDNNNNEKVLYVNVFSDGRNSDSQDSDDYRQENFYIRENGNVLFKDCYLNGVLSAYGGIRANDRHSGKVYVDIDSDLTSGGLPITAFQRAIIDSYGGMVVSANSGDSGLILRGSGIFLSTNNITLPTSGTKALGINSNGQIVTI